MAPRKLPQPAPRSFEADRFYAVDLARTVGWKGDPLYPGQELEIRGAVLTEIEAENRGAILDARPV